MRPLSCSILAAALVLTACGDDEPEPGEFGADCANDDECNGDLVCFAFGMGSQCTLPCPANPDDCPDPSSGCNEMGYCKTK